jgi:hypothetical protein
MDWTSDGIDWNDASQDEQMARGWLHNERRWRDKGYGPKSVPAGYDLDLDGRVRELVQTELDPERGWNLLMMMFRLAADDEDIKAIALGPLDEFVRNHGDAFYERIDKRTEEDYKFRSALASTLGGWPGRHRPISPGP